MENFSKKFILGEEKLKIDNLIKITYGDIKIEIQNFPPEIALKLAEIIKSTGEYMEVFSKNMKSMSLEKNTELKMIKDMLKFAGYSIFEDCESIDSIVYVLSELNDDAIIELNNKILYKKCDNKEEALSSLLNFIGAM